MHISDLVMTKHVFMFILISLTNTNKRINHARYRVHPEARPVPCLRHLLRRSQNKTLCRSGLLDVAFAVQIAVAKSS